MKIETKRLAELESALNKLEKKLRRFQTRINALERTDHSPVPLFSWLPFRNVIAAWAQSLPPDTVAILRKHLIQSRANVRWLVRQI